MLDYVTKTTKLLDAVLEVCRDVHKCHDAVRISDRLATVGDEKMRVLLLMISSFASRAESACPGTFMEVIRLTREGLSCREPSTPLDEDESPLEGHLTLLGKSPTIHDVLSLIEASCVDDRYIVRDIVTEAMKLGGFGARVFVQQAHGNDASIELVVGNVFPCEIACRPKERMTNVRTFCVDGFIETVGEIDRLLNELCESGEDAVLFVRGASEDVINTINVNNKRGVISIVLAISNASLDGLNVLNDVSVASGATLVSVTKGDVIATMGLRHGSLVDSVNVHDVEIVMSNKKTSRAMVAHVRALEKRVLVEEVEDLRDLIVKRIKKMSGRFVVIRIPRTLAFVGAQQSIDRSLRSVRQLIEHGRSQHRSESPSRDALARHVAQQCVACVTSLGRVISSADHPREEP